MQLIQNKANYEEQINTEGNNSSKFCKVLLNVSKPWLKLIFWFYLPLRGE